MKNLYQTLFIFGFLLLAGTAMSQIVISPTHNYKSDFEYSDFEVVAYGTATNESSSNMNLTWLRTVVELPEGWESMVCDNNQCYTPVVDSQEFTLNAGASGSMDVHIRPHNIEGSAIIQITVWQTVNPLVADTAYYYFDKTLSVVERLNNALKIYPNPVNDMLYVENGEDVARLDVYTVEGRLVKSFEGAYSNGLSLADIKSGNYIVRMFDAGNRQISTNLLIKD